MRRYYDELIKEAYYFDILSNGLRVCLMPKAGFCKTYGILATRYGALDQEFIPIDGTDWVNTPAGVAHFLEHKMFECEDGEDASNLFAQLGADVNAFTSHDRTAYLFSATDNVASCVETLLDFVQNPYFTEESVEKEKGIIEQEVLMYLDQPATALHMGVLEAMYEKNRIRKEIGGTVDSIQKIDVKVLNDCYRSFYHPCNMMLVVVGNVVVNDLFSIITDNQAKKHFPIFKQIKRRYYPESNIVYRKKTEAYLDVVTPKAAVGLKFGFEALDARTVFKNGIILDMIADIFFDNSSDNYRYLLEHQMIDNSFDYDCYYEATFAHLIITSDTEKVAAFQTFIVDQLLAIKDAVITEAMFMRYKRLNQALILRRFNSVEYIANLMVEFDFSQLQLFDMIDTLAQLTLADVIAFQQKFVPEAIAMHTIYPREKKN